jgi:hypothetical protein
MLVTNIFTSGLQWTGCIGVCTEAATSMTGEVRGFVVKVLEVNPEIKLYHCLLDHEALLPRLRLVF